MYRRYRTKYSNCEGCAFHFNTPDKDGHRCRLVGNFRLWSRITMNGEKNCVDDEKYTGGPVYYIFKEIKKK